MDLASILKKLNIKPPVVVNRELGYNDSSGWMKHYIDGKEYIFVQPITFTPYASVMPCSARCKFCSENLRKLVPTISSSELRPKSDYFSSLDNVLSKLKGLPLSYSLSGLEMTDDYTWFLTLLERLRDFRKESPVENSVLYTNASGFSNAITGDSMVKAVEAFKFDWAEVSRHHYNEDINQEIMRFRSNKEIKKNSIFLSAINSLVKATSVKLVCIVQENGVNDLHSLLSYIYWAKKNGIKNIIFREFSFLNDSYKKNSTRTYVDTSRVSIAKLFESFAKNKEISGKIDWGYSTNGYYFRNVMGKYQGVDLVFEVSNYSDMHDKHNSDRIYKLVFHSNGHLCADWNPSRNILYKAKSDG